MSDPLPIERQMAFSVPASWADLAEDDLEMQLMGPPPVLPDYMDPTWSAPRRKGHAKPVAPPPILPIHNRFMLLEEGSPEPQEDRSEPPGPSQPWPGDGPTLAPPAESETSLEVVVQ